MLIECEDYADSITAERVRRVIKGVPTAKDPALKAGFGGTFSYFDLGQPMRRQSILDGSNLPPYEKLASYIFFTATGEELDPAKLDLDTWFIGSSKLYDVFLIYAADIAKLKDMALTSAVAARLPEKRPRQIGIRANEVHGPGVPAPLPHHVPAVAVRNLRSGGNAAKMILKEFQKRTLATVQDYIERLDEWRGKAATLLETDPDYDWVQRGLVEGRARPRIHAAPERARRTASGVLPEDSHRRRQDAAGRQGSLTW